MNQAKEYSYICTPEKRGGPALDRRTSSQSSGGVTAQGHMTWKRKPERLLGSLIEWAANQPGRTSKG
ncbi:hypothetical protein SKAU_G00246990 [Synaphobranchus kaupii]|uniref:Uncharacterized protein n=1 Tax=Synaphobranchus kaupii TaxID=118154 RepID=A0A9Q1F218_SYNKA|nr:hypothetical protein SKAU_G00246990 [Synaphobranchus kaupii]